MNRNKEVEELTSRIMHQLYQGNKEEWFDSLRKDSLWVGSGEPFLYGKDGIIEHFENYYIPKDVNILNESYTTISIGNTSYIVSGILTIGREDGTITALTIITLVYRYIHNKPTIIYHHMSYDFTQDISQNIKEKANQHTPIPMESSMRLYMKQIIYNDKNISSIPIKIGKQTNYLDPRTIIYLSSNGHRTNIYCIDKVIDSSMNLYEFKTLLDSTFYPIRRGCIINTKYITSLKRSEVELVNQITIQIPLPSYTKVKKELNEIMYSN